LKKPIDPALKVDAGEMVHSLKGSKRLFPSEEAFGAFDAGPAVISFFDNLGAVRVASVRVAVGSALP
jgi:hypothetical protein